MEQQFDKLCLHTLRNRGRLVTTEAEEDETAAATDIARGASTHRQRTANKYPPPLAKVDMGICEVDDRPTIYNINDTAVSPGGSPVHRACNGENNCENNGENGVGDSGGGIGGVSGGGECVELRETWLDGVLRDDDCIANDREADEQLSKDVQKEIEDKEFTVLRSNSVHLYRQSRTGSQLIAPTMLNQISEMAEAAATEERDKTTTTNSVIEEPDSVIPMEQLEKEYADIMKLRIFDLAGDDLDGRPVIAFSMSYLPSTSDIDHKRLFTFVKILLDRYVENDYVVVYFHCGLSTKNKPPMKILMQEFMDLDPKYKKNLKALLLVHPTKFIKTIMKVSGASVSF